MRWLVVAVVGSAGAGCEPLACSCNDGEVHAEVHE